MFFFKNSLTTLTYFSFSSTYVMCALCSNTTISAWGNHFAIASASIWICLQARLVRSI